MWVGLGRGNEKALANALTVELGDCTRSLVGRPDVLELGIILECAKLVVTTDSGPMHIAAALGTPLVPLFGPADTPHFGPWGRP